MKSMRMKTMGMKSACIPALLGLLFFLPACSSKTATVHYKVNSEPEGAQVLYQTLGDKLPCSGQWIYLGNTPLSGVYHFNDKQVDNIRKITMKVMQAGYLDQTKEWDAEHFWLEAEGKQGIRWTPEMIPAAQ